MSKIVHQLLYYDINEDEKRFPSSLNYDGKIVSKMDRSTVIFSQYIGCKLVYFGNPR